MVRTRGARLVVGSERCPGETRVVTLRGRRYVQVWDGRRWGPR